METPRISSSRMVLAGCLASLAMVACEGPTPPAESSQNPAASPPAAESVHATELSFNTHVQPILSEYCYHCHGPDAGTREPKSEPLRLDRPEFALAPREGAPAAIVPGDPAASPVVQRMRTRDPDAIMPPPSAHKEMPEEAIQVLEQWIAQGARYEEHWAFEAPKRPQIPTPAQPDLVRNPIDALLQEKLTEAGLAPQPADDPRSLIRRASLDLTGLLPEPALVEEFAANPSEDAYQALLNRFLQTTAYAEHRARYWLDYVRYSDTHGLHFDNRRSIWPYRDFIIRSFAANKPYDQFVREQLAGDLLPAADADALIATGYIRSNVSTNEGGTIPEEIHAEKTRDRVEAFGAAFLGLTVGCAACHDHKFDPIPMDDFYSLAAFFHNTAEAAWDLNRPDPAPVLRLPDDPEQRRLLDEAVAARSQAIAKRETLRREAHKRFAQWLAAGNQPQAVPPDHLELHLPLDEGRGDIVHNRAPSATGDASWKITTNPPLWGEYAWFHPSARMDIRSDLEIPQHGDFETTDSFSVALWAKPRIKVGGGATGDGAFLARMGRAEDEQHRGWDLYLAGDKLMVHIIHRWPDQALRVEAGGVNRNEWNHIGFTYDGSARASGLRLYLNGRPLETKTTHDTLQPDLSIRTTLPLTLGSRHGNARLSEIALQEVKLFRRALPAGEFARLPFEHHTAQLLAHSPDPAQWSPWQRHFGLERFFLSQHDPEAAALNAEIARLDAEIQKLGEKGTPTLIAQARPEPPHAWSLGRGVYSNREKLLGAATPSILPPLPAAPLRSRADLAEWLFQADHPLFARVAVNRIWQEIFGTGLVDTPDDFGIMGSRPSHPELLDWLAIEFRESGWNFHHIYRLLLSSHAYRQSRTISPAALAADPGNRLLSRGPRFRMDAEMLRDTALQAAGLLVDKRGGPPVKPYQPPGIWEAVSMPESDTKSYQQDSGENLYRRSLYTFWKRFAPPPSLETFDAQARETVCVRRARTNTPLQALVSMNDPQFFEAARVLAERAIRHDPAPGPRLDFLARTLLSRPLEADETTLLEQRLANYADHYRQHPDDAAAVLTTGHHPAPTDLPADELATWTLVANQFLNLDETLVK